MVKEIETEVEFNEAMKSDNIVVVDFHATWCGPCKTFSPTFEEFDSNRLDVDCIKVDVEKGQEIAAKHAVRSIPTLVKIKKGEVIGTKTGALTKDQLEAWVNE